MVRFQWPITRKKKDEQKGSEALQQQLKIEAGLRQIKGTEFLLKRSEFTDDFLKNMCKVIEDEVKLLINKKEKTQEDKELLEFKTAQLINFEAYRALKKAGMQWSIAGEDTDMSERYSAYEKLFMRNWNNPVYQEMLLACAMYLLDISYISPHVEPAPTIWVQTPTSGTRIDLGEFGHGKEE